MSKFKFTYDFKYKVRIATCFYLAKKIEGQNWFHNHFNKSCYEGRSKSLLLGGGGGGREG